MDQRNYIHHAIILNLTPQETRDVLLKESRNSYNELLTQNRRFDESMVIVNGEIIQIHWSGETQNPILLQDFGNTPKGMNVCVRSILDPSLASVVVKQIRNGL